MTAHKAIYGCPIFDGKTLHHDKALVLSADKVQSLVEIAALNGIERHCVGKEGYLVPGYVDLQVNGGGGIQFNDAPTLESIRQICATHLQLGSTSILVTLITASPELTAMAIKAAVSAQAEKVPGFLGLHLEGPHLARARKGAHNGKQIRPMQASDVDQLLIAKQHLDHLLITVAPESVTAAQIAQLSDAGIVVSIGHSDAGFDQANAAVEAGATCVTHLFNAMSPMNHREPGVVGAALSNGRLHAGLIADGHHVHREVIRFASAAKTGPGHLFLVSDAMAPIGTDQTAFRLDGREIIRSHGRLTLADNTLAGADIDLAAAVRLVASIDEIGFEKAIQMATVHPVNALMSGKKIGKLRPGCGADFLKLDQQLNVQSIWYQGEPIDEIQT